MRSIFVSCGTWSGHRSRLGALARRVDERERAVEADLLDHLERLAEVVLGLAGEADDDVGAEGDVGDRGAHAGDEVEVALAGVGAAHRLEDARRAGLERQMDVLADGVALGDRGDHRLAEVLRVRAREADALDPVDRVAVARSSSPNSVRIAGREVAAPRVDVLAEQRDLLDAGAGELRHLGEDVARAGGSARGRGRPGRCSTSRPSCSPSRPAPTPGTGARGAAAAWRRRRGRRARSARGRRRCRRRRASRRGARSSRARTRRRRRGRARRCARAAPRRSSRRRRSRGRGRARLRAAASPR